MSAKQDLINKANAAAIRSLRGDMKATQSNLAIESKVSRKTIVEAESGNSTIQRKTLRKILIGLDVIMLEFDERKVKLANNEYEVEKKWR